MATYFNGGSEIYEAVDHQTLYLMNPTYAVEQHFVGIPLAHSSDLSRLSSLHVIRGSPAAPGMGVTLGSRYVKATRELLDEVVSVADSEVSKRAKVGPKAEKESDEDDDGARNGGVKKEELTSAQRLELHINKAKLLNMLDEVDQRYKHYQTQMHRVGSAFEQAAGAGSAKPYTSLALHTISKQFRCLKDAIASQIKETGTMMGEDEDAKEGGKTSTRLRMVEQQMRQRRAMQELGMIHNRHNAWRPQRGLPTRAVSVLRAWLFEHFLRPYPKDSDKHMLAKQTGLTRSQVSNWFINARVRLWKPMVEEMYAEEMKVVDQHQHDSGEANTTITTATNNSTLASLPSDPIEPDFSLVVGPSSSVMESIHTQRSPKRQRNSILDIHSPSDIISMDTKDDSNNIKKLFTTPYRGFGSNNYPIIHTHIGSRSNPDHYHNQQLGQGRYHHASNMMPLTLGIPHCENLLSLSADHPHQHHLFSGQAMHMDRTSDMGEPE